MADLLAVIVAFAWFGFNVTRPDTYNGRVCCDSVQYMSLARGSSFSNFCHDYDYRTLGYPLFLRLHLLAHEALHLPPQPDWVFLSLVTSFALGIASTYMLYGALRYRGIRVPRLALWLLLAHPGLASYAAVPVTDSFALSLLTFCLSCSLRLEWALHLRNLFLSAAMGLLLAWITLTRPTHYLPALALLVTFLIVAATLAAQRRAPALILLPLATVVCFAVVTAPRHLACARYNGGVPCMITAADAENNLRVSLDYASGYKTYAILYRDSAGAFHAEQRTVPDASVRHFDCLTGDRPVVTGVFRCYWQRARFLPLFFGKKIIAMFDNSHLNPYAASITTPAVRWWNRLFGLMGFAGFACLMTFTVWGIVRRCVPLQVLLPLVYLWAYLAVSLIAHIEARYGFPLVPASFIALVLLCARALRSARWKRWLVAAFLVCLCATFLGQTIAWDRVDPPFGAPPAP
jgi:hypothetical protein